MQKLTAWLSFPGVTRPARSVTGARIWEQRVREFLRDGSRAAPLFREREGGLMESKVARHLKLRHPVMGLCRSGDPLPGTKSVTGRVSLKGGFGCSMFLVAHAFREKRAESFSADTVRCPGAAAGFGLGRPGFGFPGGFMGSARLLSCGNSRFEDGRASLEELRAEGASREVLRELGDGEGFKRDPETVMASFSTLPRLPESPFEILRPLSETDSPPEVALMLADCTQLSAVAVLANYSRKDMDGVCMPFSAGCMSVAIFPLAECASESPRAVVGLTDISARVAMRRLLGRDLLSFAVPWRLFSEMEAVADESFLTRPAWLSIAQPGRPGRGTMLVVKLFNF
ncbi:MAG: DUF169 domain-containing protein [Deltaproteobacteria bacterium]|jgi:hypothetical protein|nr:DUF169 domain-containing protein [Deltaproteobacteria bacterium]